MNRKDRIKLIRREKTLSEYMINAVTIPEIEKLAKLADEEITSANAEDYTLQAMRLLELDDLATDEEDHLVELVYREYRRDIWRIIKSAAQDEARDKWRDSENHSPLETWNPKKFPAVEVTEYVSARIKTDSPRKFECAMVSLAAIQIAISIVEARR